MCRTGVRSDVFFPETTPEPIAKRLCGECPVRAECLAYALDNGAVGIWGGTSTKERRKMGQSMPRDNKAQPTRRLAG